MQLYLDVIWLLNFLFDSLLLYMTGLILKRKISKRKLFLAGFIGSLIIFSPYTPIHSVLSSPPVKVLLSVIMICIAFGFKRFRFFLTNIFMFYLCTFVTGGALIGLHYLLRFDINFANTIYVSNIQGFGDPMSWIFVLIGFPVALYFSKNTFDKFETVKIKTDQIVNLSIVINGHSVQLKGLIDSGNQLYDPLTKKPVMIASLQKTNHLFPEKLLPVFKDVNLLWEMKEEELDGWQNKISIIPYRVVGQENRLIAAIKPDMVNIQKDDETHQVNQVLIAFINQNLSSDDLFDCIVHPKMLIQASEKQVS